MAKKQWKIEGYDTFEGGPDAFYSLPGEFDDEPAAQAAAREQLAELEKTQPTSQSGGQSEQGIQDRVYIVRPDETKYRFTG
jgi:hypothetical protein